MNNEKPLLSIIVTTFNTQQWVDVCLQSLLDQDYPNKEIIVVDDGSTDDSVKKAEVYLTKGVKVFSKEHTNAPDTRNFGFKQSKGKYVLFFDTDKKLMPGVLSKQIKFLEENPEYGFYYGGYKICDDNTLDRTVMEFRSEPFDLFFLRQFNFIDGSSLMRRVAFEYAIQKQGGWDINIKSLQDWDLWLTITEKFVGFFSPEINFATYLPGSSGISKDSHANWLERMDAIKKKHNLKDNEICVTSLGAPFHARKMAKILNADFRQHPNLKPHRYKMIYLLGFYPQAVENHASIFQGHKGIRLIHWIGTDILQFMNMPYASALKFKEFLKAQFPYQLSEVNFTQKELQDLGVKTEIVPLPVEAEIKPIPLPKEFTVAVYLPEHNRNIYLPEFIMEVAKMMPDVKFKIFGTATETGQRDNLEFMGYVNNMKELIANTSCLLRITQHDGFPLGIAEWILAGRQVVFNHELPFTQKVGIDLEQVINSLRKLKKESINIQAASYYAKWLDKNKYKKIIYSYLNKPKGYKVK